MKDLVKTGHLTKYDAFGLNRDQVIDLEIWFKIHTNISNFEAASPKIILTRKIFMISVKMGKQCDFHLSFFQIVGTRQDFTAKLIWF